MRNLLVSDGAARLIEWLRADKGMEVTTEWLCDAFCAEVNMLGNADDIGGNDLLPLKVMAKYYELVSELAVQPVNGETTTFNNNTQDNK